MSARDDDWQTARPAGFPRPLAAVGALVAGLLVAVFARVDTESPDRLVVERPTFEPTPAAIDAEAVWQTIGSWRRMPVAPIRARLGHVAEWSGACVPHKAPRTCGELLVWGGWSGRRPLVDGAAYDPSADAWRVLPDAPRALPLSMPLPSVWTGTPHEATVIADPERGGELIVWGATAADLGLPGARTDEPRGVALDPAAGSWRVLPEAPIAPRVGHSMTWTGAEVVVWGGRSTLRESPTDALADGAAYDPETDTWRVLPAAPLRARSDHVAVYLAGPQAILVWAGRGGEGADALTDGAVYLLSERRWRHVPPPPLSPAGTPWQPAAAQQSSAQDAALMIAPLVDAAGRPALAHYDAGSEAWQVRSAGPVGLRTGAQAAGYGNVVVVWGGSHPAGRPLPAGAVYYGNTGGWRGLGDRYRPRSGDRAVWTGSELLVWGGGTGGAVFNPSAPPGTGTRSQPPGEERTATLPAGMETNWPLLPRPPDKRVAVTVRGPAATQVAVWLTTGHGSQAKRREPTLVGCAGANLCQHEFAHVPPLVPGIVRLHLANRDDEPASIQVSVDDATGYLRW